LEVQKTKDHIVLKTNRLVANRWGKYGGGFVFRLVFKTIITALTYQAIHLSPLLPVKK
jgi:hypothetical protein